MGITLRVEVCRKEGTASYGSIGASYSVDGIELPAGASDEAITRIRDHWTAFCQISVDTELARLRAGADAGPASRPASPAPAPAAAEPPRKARSEWGTADHGRAAEPTDGRTGRAPSAGRNGNSNRDGVPRSGGALYARLKEMDERDAGLGMVKRIARWAKNRGNDARMSDWGRDDVAEGWAEAESYLEALRESDSLQSAGNGAGY